MSANKVVVVVEKIIIVNWDKVVLLGKRNIILWKAETCLLRNGWDRQWAVLHRRYVISETSRNFLLTQKEYEHKSIVYAESSRHLHANRDHCFICKILGTYKPLKIRRTMEALENVLLILQIFTVFLKNITIFIHFPLIVGKMTHYSY